MTDKNLFLGDSAYPHEPSGIEAMYPDSAQRNHAQALINRIEQLERELAQEKTRYTGCFHMLIAEQDSNSELCKKVDRYDWLFERDITDRFNSCYRKWDGENGLYGFERVIDIEMFKDQPIYAAIKEGEA